MAQRNDSSQMKQCLSQHYDLIPTGNNDEPENVKAQKEDEARAEAPPRPVGGVACDHTCPSTCGASCTADARRKREGSRRTTEESSCCSLLELRRQSDVRLGPLRFGSAHTVLIDVNMFAREGRLRPQDGRDLWNSNFVKMPCSPSNTMVKPGLMASGPARRWDVISKQLRALASKTEADVADVQKAIMKYNPKYEKQWQFDNLASFVKVIPKEENYFRALFPKMASLALKLPRYIKKAVPLLSARRGAAITLSQRQVACLLANAFFCTFPHRNATGANTEYCNYPSINFSSLFGKASQRKREKLRAVMHYFKQVTDSPPDGLVTFERRCLGDADLPNWPSCQDKLPKLHVTSHGSIDEEGAGMLQVDFAASWIGGGVLGSGLLQEEILFLMHPELIVSRLFTQRLEDNECLIITGCQQFSTYSGFGDSFEWAGPRDDTAPRDEWRRRQRRIVAMDALHFRQASEQYDMRRVRRELNKAYCGFKADRSGEPDVATGKWGCGAFNGDPQLKALIQLMAAAAAGRGLAFFTFRDEKVKRDVEQMYNVLVREDATVGKLYDLIQNFCSRSRGPHVEVLEFLQKSLGPSRSQL